MTTFKISVFDQTDKTIDGNICFDTNGNAYLCVVPNDTNQSVQDAAYINNLNSLYQINVNNRDEPYFEKGEFKIINDDKSQQINLLDIIAKSDNSNEDDDKSDEEDEIKEVEEDYFPENKKYIIDNKNVHGDDNSDEYNDNLEGDEFLFAGNDNINVNEREFGDTKALYDTIVYDQNFTVCFKTCADSYILYRLNIYYDGRIIMRPICGIDKHYRVYLNQQGELYLVKI